MGVEVFGLGASAAWDAALEPHQPDGVDVYFKAGYHRAHCLSRPEQARLFVFRRDGEQLTYPFRLREIQRVGDAPVGGRYQDIESVYGFTGPLATTNDAAFLTDAWSAFADWAGEQKVVAEFVRFNPLLANEPCAPAEMTCEWVREHVVVDLRLGPDRTWHDAYSKNNRNMIRKAERQGLTTKFEDLGNNVEAFVRLYHETMARNRAADEYYFDLPHFETLARSVPTRVCVARRAGLDVAISLFLIGPDWMHYHLSGCSVEGLGLAANNLILHEAILEASRLGLRLLHLGGGRTGAADDALLRFKSGFSPLRRPVMIGRRVHLPGPYEEFCALRRKQVSSIPASFFLAYRYEPRPNHAAPA